MSCPLLQTHTDDCESGYNSWLPSKVITQTPSFCLCRKRTTRTGYAPSLNVESEMKGRLSWLSSIVVRPPVLPGIFLAFKAGHLLHGITITAYEPH